MFANPKQNVGALELREGMRVADFGAGLGEYTKSASIKVGNNGKVFAIEVQKDLVKKLESEIKDLGLTNVSCIWGDIETIGGTKIAEASVDAVIVSNVLFQSSDRLGLADEAKRILKHGGKLLLVDWKESFGGMGPAPHHVVKESVAMDIFTKRGFKMTEKISDSSHHYGIIFIHE